MRAFKHPEQMTPGTIWKVKGMKGLRYLEDDYVIGTNYRKWQPRTRWNPNATTLANAYITDPVPELEFELKTLYLLIDFEHTRSGWVKARFLGPEKIVSVEMYEVFWDKTFRLAKRTRSPKKVKRLLFGKYDVIELKKKLGMVNE